MLAFIIRRLLQAVVVMLTVALIAFTLFRFVGDPINQMVGIETSAEERAQLRQDLGLNDPIPIQFTRFVWNATRLNFGNSYQFKTPVIDLIADRFPATMELALASAIFSLMIGIPMGVYTALHRRSLLSNVFLAASLVGISLPTFLIGILLIFLFPVTLRRLYIVRDDDRAGDGAVAGLFDRAQSVGIEATVLSPQCGDFNEDLRNLDINALRAALRVQIAPEDVTRFLSSRVLTGIGDEARTPL